MKPNTPAQQEAIQDALKVGGEIEMSALDNNPQYGWITFVPTSHKLDFSRFRYRLKNYVTTVEKTELTTEEKILACLERIEKLLSNQPTHIFSLPVVYTTNAKS